MSSVPLTRCLLVIGFAFALLPLASADPSKPRVGWQGFGGEYRGGYSIGGPVGAAAGPARIRIRAARDGRSARVTWKNTFYSERGSRVITLRWNFRSNGTVTVSTLDPRVRTLAGSGTFVVHGKRPVRFTLADASGQTAVTGEFRLIGGGALSITANLTGSPEGDTPFAFSGGRN